MIRSCWSCEMTEPISVSSFTRVARRWRASGRRSSERSFGVFSSHSGRAAS